MAGIVALGWGLGARGALQLDGELSGPVGGGREVTGAEAAIAAVGDDPGQRPAEVVVRVDPDEPTGSDQRECGAEADGALFTACVERVVPDQVDAAQRPLAPVVVERDVRVFQEAGQRVLMLS